MPQFETLLQPISPLTDAVNINVLWANLIVEECCRLGVTVRLLKYICNVGFLFKKTSDS